MTQKYHIFITLSILLFSSTINYGMDNLPPHIAKVFTKQKNYSLEAIKLLKSPQEKILAYEKLSDVYTKKGRSAKATEQPPNAYYYQKACDYHKAYYYSKKSLDCAKQLIKVEYNEKIRKYLELAQENPKLNEESCFFHVLGDLYNQIENYNKADKNYFAALSLSNNSHDKAMLYNKIGNLSTKLHLYRCPKFSLNYYKLKYNIALQYYQKALHLSLTNKQKAIAHERMGDIQYERLGDRQFDNRIFKDAMQHFKNSAQLSEKPEHKARVYCKLGELYEHKGDQYDIPYHLKINKKTNSWHLAFEQYEKAATYFLASFDLSKDDSQAIFSLEYMYSKTQQLNKAKACDLKIATLVWPKDCDLKKAETIWKIFRSNKQKKLSEAIKKFEAEVKPISVY